jgi:hypothetical protein
MRKLSLGIMAGLACASAAFSPTLASTHVRFHHPRNPAKPVSSAGWAATNWSGYAVARSGVTYSSVTGQWVVPAVSATKRATYSSNWIGIDGFNNSNLIQTGSEQDYYNGSGHYNAWWEILPAAETRIASITVHPGDTMTASIKQGSGGSWTISISDTNTGQSFTTNQTYTGPQTSAEWIEEAPTVGGRVARLANYGHATFDPGTDNGGNPGLGPSDGGVMIQNGVQVSTPSNPDTDTDGFTMAYGSSTPSPPPS